MDTADIHGAVTDNPWGVPKNPSFIAPVGIWRLCNGMTLSARSKPFRAFFGLIFASKIALRELDTRSRQVVPTALAQR